MPSNFEALYQWFMAKGGFEQPASNEDTERRVLLQKRAERPRCKHGRTILSCQDCFFERFQDEGK